MISLKASMRCRSKSSGCLAMRSAVFIKFLLAKAAQCRVQVPFVAWLGTSALQPIRIVLAKFQTPLTDGFMGDVDPAFEQQFLHVTIAQREAVIEPDPMADDLAGKAVIFVALGVSRWGHVACLSFG